MDSSSKQCTNFCAISRTVLPRGESSDNANPSWFPFRMHQPVFVLWPCTLKLSLLLLCSGLISSGFCLTFDHLWIILLRTDNSWISHSNSFDKYIRWTCALLDISTQTSPIISSIFHHIFGDIISSIECGCAVLISRSDKEDTSSRRIWFWFCVSSSTCQITPISDEWLLSQKNQSWKFWAPKFFILESNPRWSESHWLKS